MTTETARKAALLSRVMSLWYTDAAVRKQGRRTDTWIDPSGTQWHSTE